MFTRRVLLAGAALASLMAAPGLGLAQHAALEPDPATNVRQEMPRRYMMEDLYGNVVTNEDFQGKFVLVYFGYTGCPDVCPTSLSTMAEALERLGDEKAAGIAPLFVTVDPDRDTAKLMRDYLEFFDPRIFGLRGPVAYTDHMVKAFNARYEKHIPDPNQPDLYSIDHTASIAFLDPGGFLIKRYPHGTSAEAIAEDMGQIMDEAMK